MALVFKWSLDSVSTELVKSLPGTLNGTAAFTASDGVGGCYGPLVASDIETGLVCDISSVPFNPDTGGTISFFMKTPATVSSKVAVGFMGATGANDLNGLFVEFDSLVPTAKWPKDESSQVLVTDSSGVISGNMGQWHHIALVWTGLLTQAEVEAGGLIYVDDTSYHNIAIYIDGVSSATGVYQTKTEANSSLTRNFCIGWHDSDQTNGGILFDDVSVYNEALTGATINTLKTTFIAGLTEVWETGGATQYTFPLNNSLAEENNPSLSFSLNKEVSPPFTATAIRGVASYGPTVYQTDSIPLYGTLSLPGTFSLVNGGSFHFFFRNDVTNTKTLGVGFLDNFGSQKAYNNFILQLGYNEPRVSTPAGCSLSVSSYSFKRIPIKTWAHFCATLGRVVGTDKYRVRMFVNGVLKGEQIWTLGTTYANAINELSVKQFYLDYNTGDTKDTDVVIDHLVILDKELTEAEVQAAAMTCYPNGTSEAAVETKNSAGGRWPFPAGYTVTGAPRVRTNAPADIEQVPLLATLKVFVIDAETIVVSGDFSGFYNTHLQEEYGDSMYYQEMDWRVGSMEDWLIGFHYRYCIAELQKDYEPLIIDKYASDNYFMVNGDSVTTIGTWINASEVFNAYDVYDQTRLQSIARGNRIHHAYLRLQTPMTDGQEYTVTDLDGNTITFTYSKAKPVSSIKVNQVGYSPNAGRKYAYFGAWLGTGGAYEKSFTNQPFYLTDATTGDTVFTGTMELRNVQDVKSFSGNNYIITGEKVYQCDFSSFNTAGRYQVYIPGVGYSFPFLLDEEAVQKQFYTHARGLFHQRSGCAKSSPQTQALNLPADYTTTYRGSFPPNNRDYKGFCGNSQFEAIKRYDEAGTQVPLRDVYGGWWDAADWDRRPYHFHAVGDLLNAYLMSPGNFCDGQLDLPESGNGIPDILSEAEWGLDIWRKLQMEDGGVGCWVEMRSHPRYPDFAHTSKAKMYASCPTCEGSWQYAYYAAKFVVCLRLAAKQASTSVAGALLANKKADLFLESAMRAFDYGRNDANFAPRTYSAGGITETWSETTTLRDTWKFLAAQALYAASLSDTYKPYLTIAEYRALSVTTNNTDSFSRYIPHEIFLVDGFDDIKEDIRTDVVRDANTWLAHMEGYAYRNVHYSNNWITYMSWGVGHSASRGKVFATAYWLTQDERYKDALYLILDWNVGCNALGRSHTSGLGTVTPVRFLYNVGNWIMERDQTLTVQEPPPGITVYTYGGTAIMDEAMRLFGVFENARSGGTNFTGISLNLLPGEYMNTVGHTSSTVRTWLALNRPIWRAYSALEGWTVAQNEFTIWETISPNVLCAAACLSSGFTPPASWKTVTPSSDYRTCEGYVFLP